MMYHLNEEIKVNIGSEWIAKNLCPGDNVAMPTLINKPFWQLLVDKGPRIIVISFNDEDGIVWTKDVVHGFWYQRLVVGSQYYTLCDDKPHAFVFPNLILASKKFMPPTCHDVKGKYATYGLT